MAQHLAAGLPVPLLMAMVRPASHGAETGRKLLFALKNHVPCVHFLKKEMSQNCMGIKLFEKFGIVLLRLIFLVLVFSHVK